MKKPEKLKSFDEFFGSPVKKEFTITNTNEAVIVMDENYKVKVTVDVPKSLISEYISKVKEETGKDPLENFSNSEIAEQLVLDSIKKNLTIDNLSSSTTVGVSSAKDEEQVEADKSEVDDTFETPDEESSDIEFSLEDGEPDETIEIEDDITADGDDGYETISFDDDEEEPKTIGDYKEKRRKNEEEYVKEEEEDIIPDETIDLDTLYSRIGVKTNAFEQLKFSDIYKK